MASFEEATKQNRIPKKHNISQNRSEKKIQSLVGLISYKFRKLDM
jgi:hypothetical protein